MALLRAPALVPLLAACTLLAGCALSAPPFAQLSGLLVDGRLDEVSGLAASRRHDDTLWVHNDGGNGAQFFALGLRGQLRGTLTLAGIENTDWEDLAAFELDGKPYLLVADTGDNGGLRRTLQLHVVEDPATLPDNATVRPAWSIVFRWPDGARDCEAVAVDAARGEVLLVSKKRKPAELFTLPLRPKDDGVQVARPAGELSGVPTATPAERRADPARARLRGQVTAADLSPDDSTLAVLTYDHVLLYGRHGGETWQQALARRPRVHELALLPQAEALGWARDGHALYATGEFVPAPLLLLTPPS